MQTVISEKSDATLLSLVCCVSVGVLYLFVLKFHCKLGIWWDMAKKAALFYPQKRHWHAFWSSKNEVSHAWIFTKFQSWIKKVESKNNKKVRTITNHNYDFAKHDFFQCAQCERWTVPDGNETNLIHIKMAASMIRAGFCTIRQSFHNNLLGQNLIAPW